MNRYNIREITSKDDIDQLKNLWCERSKRMRTPVTDQLVAFEKNMSFGTPVGAFDKNNILVGTMKYKRFSNLPYMFISHLHIKKNIQNICDFSNEANPTALLFDYILKKSENDQVYTWYLVRPLSKVEHNLYKKGKDWFKQSNLCFDKESQEHRYDRYVEEIIKSGESSKHKTFRFWLGEKPWKPNLVLFKCVLKNKYRVNGDVFENESSYC